MDHGIELLWYSGLEVVADSLALGPVDNANGPLQPRLSQGFSQPGVAS
jgi:hypothetical protein